MIAAMLFLTLFVALVRTAPTGPTVTLDNGTFIGLQQGNVVQYLGIPYAEPPVRQLRLQRPKPVAPYTSLYDATKFGHSCLQQVPDFNLTSKIGKFVDYTWEHYFNRKWPDHEDCLTVNVIVPDSAVPASRLPVVVWIYGGAFTMGTTVQYRGESVVSRSVELGEPIIFVSLNYRLGILGFLGGKQIKKAGLGNLGLLDQRLALRWVQRYISAFGGDPTKVTLWGESAGAMSIGMQLITNGGNTEGLFRGAFMQSGAPIPVGDMANSQRVYDNIMDKIGCGHSRDQLQCFREVPYPKVKNLADDTPGNFFPQVDGTFLIENPFESVMKGRIARVPIVTGGVEDEGTIFSLFNFGPSSNDEFKDWIKGKFLSSVPDANITKVAELYPANPVYGSPYNTGNANKINSQYKRMASVLGDLIFEAPRRHFLRYTAGRQKTWVYLSKKGKKPYIGAYHTSTIKLVFERGELQDYVIRFVVHLDPNMGPNSTSLIRWPQYTAVYRETLVIEDGGLSLGNDTFRARPIEYLEGLGVAYPL